MSERVSLALPETLVYFARAVADRTQRPLEAILTEWIELTAAVLPIEQLFDDQGNALEASRSSAPDITRLCLP
jgi:hypothetical protein